MKFHYSVLSIFLKKNRGKTGYFLSQLYVDFIRTVLQRRLSSDNYRKELLRHHVKVQICKFWMVVPCIWFEIRVNYQLDANICLF